MPKAKKKPTKPYADFPLFPHATGRWAKKIRGKLHYFGPWNDSDAALQKYLDQRDDLQAGRTPRKTGDGLIVQDLCNRYLTAKKYLLENGELRPHTFQSYYRSCRNVIDTFGKYRLVDDLAPDDFEHLRATLPQTRGPVSLGNEVRQIRMVFKYAYDAGLTDRPIRYGLSFKMPSKRILAVLIPVIGFVGCGVPVSLGDPEKSKMQKEYVGLWLLVTDGDYQQLVDVQAFDSRAYVVHWMLFHKKTGKPLEGILFKAWLTDIKGVHFLTLKMFRADAVNNPPQSGDLVTWGTVKLKKDRLLLHTLSENSFTGVKTPAQFRKVLAKRLKDGSIDSKFPDEFQRVKTSDKQAQRILAAFCRK
ncbi:MAG: hypothetical protein IID45_06180 [Planctomycetes bacterium]|nr:hypothetical protein [Planctomycetota bacterium]